MPVVASALTASLYASLMVYMGDLRYEFNPLTSKDGTAYVSVISTTNEPSVVVTVKGSDGTEVQKSLKLKANKAGKITWHQKGKLVEYDLHAEAGEQYLDASFEIKKAVAGGKQGQFKMVSGREEIVDRHTIRYQTPFTISSWEFEVYNTDGVKIVDKVGSDTYEAGMELTMSWDRDDEVFMIRFYGEDDLGNNAESKIVPWSIHIPHTEVIFDSGKYDIKGVEEWKVKEAFAVLVHELEGIERANKAVGANLQGQLYIVGYTDTVGKAGKNQVLSQDRARAIATYFRDQGAWCEIYYAGMGERGLGVQTGDGVDEARNRRALYLLGVQKPAAGGQVPGNWKKLADARPRTLTELPDPPQSYLDYKAKKRAKAGGGGANGGGSGVGGEDGGTDGDDEWGKADPDSLGGGGSSRGNGAEGSGSEGGDPPSSEGGGVGASGKNCAVSPDMGRAPLGGVLGVLGLLGLRAGRRRRFRVFAAR